jgi:predicted ATPase
VAELNRRKGQLLLRQGHTEAAEELYRKALSTAMEQEAKLWELRAAVSIARLWGEQGRGAEARELLAPVCGWFTEGFDTPDLKEAKALLEALNLSPTTLSTTATSPKRRLVRAEQNPLAQSAGQSD